MKSLFPLFFGLVLSCGLYAQADLADAYLHSDQNLKNALVGVVLYDVAGDRVLYSHNENRFFTVASNNKLYTLYAASLYLTDSTTGIQYQKAGDTLYIRGTGDPTFLHPNFTHQPVFDFLKDAKSPIALVNTAPYNPVFGPGWAWDDYNAGYQPERSNFPIYGNVVRFSLEEKLHIHPSFFSAPEKLAFDTIDPNQGFYVRRNRQFNEFYYRTGMASSSKKQDVPFITSPQLTRQLLRHELHKTIFLSKKKLPEALWRQKGNVPLDSLLKPMMHQSDNFFAEQTQAMVAQALIHKPDIRMGMRYLLENDFDFLPNKPVLVDGSGLSRYNLSTPADLIAVLKALRNAMEESRLFEILPTGGEGTLEGYYENLAGKIYGKTGTLNGAVAFSGYLKTKNNRDLIFSVVLNGLTRPLHTGREATENFLQAVYSAY